MSTHRRTSLRFLIIALASLIALNACSAFDPPPTPPLVSETTASSDWLAVYFTEPGNTSLRGGPDSHLAAAIDAARVSVDAALYDLDLWSIRDALLAAHQRGVAVRLVVESDSLDRPELQALIAAGIPVLGDRRDSLMHDKFVVIDHGEVWTGSMNLTVNGAYRNDNNLLRVRSTQLAENYTHEFEEMYLQDLFSDASRRDDTPNPAITVNGVPIATAFSPDDGVQALLLATIDQATESVYLLAYALTADPISAALAAARDRGLTVAAVLDAGQVGASGADYPFLLESGIPVRLDGNPSRMHHKVLILDGHIVVTGSYNFTRSAEERNDENVLVIDSRDLAAQYLAEFARILDLSK